MHLDIAADDSYGAFFTDTAGNIPAGETELYQVYQHMQNEKSWSYTFEHFFNFNSSKHMFSYLLPYDGSTENTKFGDVAASYRYLQFENENLTISPQISFIFPTDKTANQEGSRPVAYSVTQFISGTISQNIFSRFAISATHTPGMLTEEGRLPNTMNYVASGGLIYVYNSKLNLSAEIISESSESVNEESEIEKESSLFFVPAVRTAWNISKVWTFLPGAGSHLGLGPSAEDTDYFADLRLVATF